MSGASSYQAPPRSGLVLSAIDKAAVMQHYSTAFLDPPWEVERRWQQCQEKHPRWTAHLAVRCCATACEKMGLNVHDISTAIRLQRDAMLKESLRIVLARDDATANDLVDFLSHRGEPPAPMGKLIEKSMSLAADWSVYCAIRCLAGIATSSRVSPVDLHEAVRRVYDRVSQVGGERTVWMPS